VLLVKTSLILFCNPIWVTKLRLAVASVLALLKVAVSGLVVWLISASVLMEAAAMEEECVSKLQA